MTAITPEQRSALAEAGDSPVEVLDPQSGDPFVLVRTEVYRKLRDQLEDKEDRRDREAWAQVSRHARDQWARENPY